MEGTGLVAPSLEIRSVGHDSHDACASVWDRLLSARGHVKWVHAYVAVVGACGAAVIAASVEALPQLPLNGYLLALTVLTLASGSFTVKVPGRSATISISEIFIFITLRMFGPAAATLIVAAEGCALSARQRDRCLYRTIFNVTEPAISTWVAGSAFIEIGRVPLVAAHAQTPLGMLPTLGMAVVFFLLNMMLQTTAVVFETGASATAFWRRHAAPLALNYYAAASLAALVVSGKASLDVNALGLVLPLIVLSYMTYREATNRVEEAQRHLKEVEHFHEQARRRDEELRQAQKLEAIGRLAGGVAHDFNNVLTAISGFGNLLRDDIIEGHAKLEDVDEVLKAADRAAGLTRQLLAFGRRQLVSPRVLDLKQVVTGTEKMLRQLLTEDIRLTTDLDHPIGSVKADPGQVEQVLLNLVVNARDAMADGGLVRIALASSAPAAATGDRQRRHVRLSVSDTGCGIPESVLPQIFEPFFTTKAEGRGTGLGLATVYGIVQQAGGTIEIESVVDEGTTFHVFFPETAATLENASACTVGAGRQTGQEAVLIVEDDVAVSAFVVAGLRKAGYQVLSACDAEEALAISRRHLGSIDLLLTDVVMRGMNGRRLAEQLVRTRPLTRVLYMSGYPDDAVLARGIETNAASFLQKPFSIDALITKIRDVMTPSVPDREPSPSILQLRVAE